MSKFVSGKNYFNEESLAMMIEELENGEEIEIGIDCIGHTRHHMESAAYVRALKKKYGDKIIIDDEHYTTKCKLV